MIQRFVAAAVLVVLTVLVVRGWVVAPSNSSFRIARDASWYPLNLASREGNLVGFSDDLLTEIASSGRLHIRLMSSASNQLFRGLHDGVYDGVLTSLQPTVPNKGFYDLSEVFFYLGPVLTVRSDSPFQSLDSLEGGTIGVPRARPSYINLLQSGKFNIVPFDNMSIAISSLLQGEVQGLILGHMTAHSYTQGQYRGQLRIVPKELTNEGLRLVTVKEEAPNLIKQFNEGLKQVRDDGRYLTLLNKWALEQ